MEERNVKISLDKAREWYKKGGELKELALSAFSEEEITTSALPKTWEEFCNMYPMKYKEYYIDIDSIITGTYNSLRLPNTDKNMLPSLEAAKSHLAYMQLHQLRDCYRQGWKPDWSNNLFKYCIALENNQYIIYQTFVSCHFLSFQSRKIAEEFLKNFKDLIETAGDLI